MTRKEFCKKYEVYIREIALEADVDMGVARDLFCMSAMIGKVARGNEPELVRALECIGNDDFYANLHEEYIGVEDVEFPEKYK